MMTYFTSTNCTHSPIIFVITGMDTSEQDMHNIVIFTGKATHLISVLLNQPLCLSLKILKPYNRLQYNSITLLYTFSLHSFSERMISLALYRKQLYTYLEEKMATVAPNLSALIGETVAARLIQKAGSLTSLAKCPASTVQILGAEKALFRALKTKGNTPKYGLIYHSSFIGRASAKNKGRISRYLSNKCAIASRIDSFIEEPTSAYGE
jgi:snoRNA binding domain, fibrillarin